MNSGIFYAEMVHIRIYWIVLKKLALNYDLRLISTLKDLEIDSNLEQE